MLYLVSVAFFEVFSQLSTVPCHSSPDYTMAFHLCACRLQSYLCTVARGHSQTPTRQSLSSGHWWLPATCKTKVSKVATGMSLLFTFWSPFSFFSHQLGFYSTWKLPPDLCSESLTRLQQKSPFPPPPTEVPFCSPHSLSLSICSTFFPSAI